MSVGLPSDDVLRELDSRHDEVLAQITELDERLLRVLSSCQGYRGEPREQVEEPQGERIGQCEQIAQDSQEASPDLFVADAA